MISIYTKHRSSRLIYTLDVVFKEWLGVDYVLFDDIQKIPKNIPCINYTNEVLDFSNIHIQPHGLLFEDEIKTRLVDVFFENEIPYVFQTKSTGIKQDVFSAVFYMISRYEEYLPFKKDHHDRFKAEDSLAYVNSFLQKPVVDIWVNELKQVLQSKFPELAFKQDTYQFINTLDIDVAYAFKGKGLLRFMAALSKDVLKLDIERLQKKWDYISKKADHYDTYDFIEKQCQDHQVDSIYFFLLGDYAAYDKNISYQNKVLQALIKRLSKNNQTGIHPSYQSNSKIKNLEIEIQRLAKIKQEDVVLSRQHYLKLRFPYTYENLIEQGVQKDYTMGFASQVGFRAGTSRAFSFYNLAKEQKRPLIIVPFQVMDGTLNQYMGLTPEASCKVLDDLIAETQKVNGCFVSLWHNSSLSEEKEWKDWRKVYAYLIEKASR